MHVHTENFGFNIGVCPELAPFSMSNLCLLDNSICTLFDFVFKKEEEEVATLLGSEIVSISWQISSFR